MKTGAVLPSADFSGATSIDFGFRPEVSDAASAINPSSLRTLFIPPIFTPPRKRPAYDNCSLDTGKAPPESPRLRNCPDDSWPWRAPLEPLARCLPVPRPLRCGRGEERVIDGSL